MTSCRERLKVENITERGRKTRQRWFGQVKRRDHEYIGRKTLEMVPQLGEEEEEDESID